MTTSRMKLQPSMLGLDQQNEGCLKKVWWYIYFAGTNCITCRYDVNATLRIQSHPTRRSVPFVYNIPLSLEGEIILSFALKHNTDTIQLFLYTYDSSKERWTSKTCFLSITPCLHNNTRVGTPSSKVKEEAIPSVAGGSGACSTNQANNGKQSNIYLPMPRVSFLPIVEVDTILRPLTKLGLRHYDAESPLLHQTRWIINEAVKKG